MGQPPSLYPTAYQRVNLSTVRTMEARINSDKSVSKRLPSSSGLPLRRDLQAHYFIPDLKSVRTFPTILCRLKAVAARTKVFADRPEGGEEALGMARRLEAPHRSLTLPRRLVRVFRPIVQPPVATMLNAWHDLLLGCRIAPELVRDQHPWDVRAALQ